MTRTEAVARITASLSSLDDKDVQTVAGLVETMVGEPSALPRPLTARELALIEQSKEDFRLGRTVTLDEARTLSDDFMKTLRAKYPNAP